MKKISCLMVLLVLAGSSLLSSVNAEEDGPELQVTFSGEVYTISPGNQGVVSVTVSNIGDESIQGVRIVVDSEVYYLQEVGDWSRSYGSLSGGSSFDAAFHFSVPANSKPGLYELEFTVTTANAGSRTQYATIKVEEIESIDVESFSPTYLDIGQQTTMTLVLSNRGLVNITDIILSWVDEYTYILPIGTDNRISVPYIEAGTSTEVCFDVMVSPSLPAGVYPIYFTMQYYDKVGTLQSIESQIGVQIGGATDFEVIVEDSSSSSTTLSIANIGANTASSVIVRIPTQVDYVASGTDSVNIGNLDAGDYTLATFQITQQTTDTNGTDTPFGQDRNMTMNAPQMPDGEMGDMGDMSEMGGRPDFMNSTFPGFSGGGTLRIEIIYTDLFGVRQTVETEVDLSSSSVSVSTGDMSFPSGFSSSSNFQSQEDSSSFELDSGTSYILIGALGIVIIISLVKFNSIKKLPKALKNWKGRHYENE